ncbi:oxidoreductase/ transition metal ion binding protein [Corchorus olitorius]|uniref:Oxidoreductase/ transition metal ion binding protein n=1 Tax=Corchorus olitorius TaxID=93759 RepID=A0A1R3GEC0_9ROSI|nr:oxidoreductase/ transition metal ion binding protein [Corchorus olitorius]
MLFTSSSFLKRPKPISNPDSQSPETLDFKERKEEIKWGGFNGRGFEKRGDSRVSVFVVCLMAEAKSWKGVRS